MEPWSQALYTFNVPTHCLASKLASRRPQTFAAGHLSSPYEVLRIRPKWASSFRGSLNALKRWIIAKPRQLLLSPRNVFGEGANYRFLRKVCSVIHHLILTAKDTGSVSSQSYRQTLSRPLVDLCVEQKLVLTVKEFSRCPERMLH